MYILKNYIKNNKQLPIVFYNSKYIGGYFSLYYNIKAIYKL